jgi:hypothetical protein
MTKRDIVDDQITLPSRYIHDGDEFVRVKTDLGVMCVRWSYVVGYFPASSAPAADPAPFREIKQSGRINSQAFVNAQKELTEDSINILRKARDEGYNITFANEGMVAAQMDGAQPIYFTSNWDIQDWANTKGWV